MQLRNIALGYKIYLSRVAFSVKMSRLGRIIRLKMNRKAPVSLLLGLTYDCQCHCEYCGVDSYQPLQGEGVLDLNEIKKLIDGFGRLGLFNVTLTGGEPLLRRDLPEIASQISSKGIFVTLNTNGLLLDLERAKELKMAGVGLVKVSLDSATPERHDAVRGVKGCFQRVTEAIENCNRLDIPCVIACTLINFSGEAIEEELNEIVSLGKRINATAIKIQLPRYAGRCYNRPDKLLDDEEMSKIKKILLPGYVYTTNFYANLNECPFLKRWDCYVSPFGEMQPCAFIPIYFGNILEEDADVIWRRMMEFMEKRFLNRVCLLSIDRFKDVIDNIVHRAATLPEHISRISL